jgi:hypothetical protein
VEKLSVPIMLATEAVDVTEGVALDTGLVVAAVVDESVVFDLQVSVVVETE